MEVIKQMDDFIVKMLLILEPSLFTYFMNVATGSNFFRGKDKHLDGHFLLHPIHAVSSSECRSMHLSELNQPVTCMFKFLSLQ